RASTKPNRATTAARTTTRLAAARMMEPPHSKPTGLLRPHGPMAGPVRFLGEKYMPTRVGQQQGPAKPPEGREHLLGKGTQLLGRVSNSAKQLRPLAARQEQGPPRRPDLWPRSFPRRRMFP